MFNNPIPRFFLQTGKFTCKTKVHSKRSTVLAVTVRCKSEGTAGVGRLERDTASKTVRLESTLVVVFTLIRKQETQNIHQTGESAS